MTFEELDLTLVHGNYDASEAYQSPLPPTTHRTQQNVYRHDRGSKPPRSSFHEVEMTRMEHHNKRDRVIDDLPAPVLPTIPTFCPAPTFFVNY